MKELLAMAERIWSPSTSSPALSSASPPVLSSASPPASSPASIAASIAPSAGIVSRVLSSGTTLTEITCLPVPNTSNKGIVIVKIQIYEDRWSVYSIVVNGVALPYKFDINVSFDSNSSPIIQFTGRLDDGKEPSKLNIHKTMYFNTITIRFYLNEIISVVVYNNQASAYEYVRKP